jgi:Bax protein
MTIRSKTKTMTIFAGLSVLAIAVIYWAVQPSDPDFSTFEAGPERKQAFFNYFLPIIQQRNQEILETRLQLQEWEQNRDAIGWWDARRIQSLAEDYRMEAFDIESDADWATLLRRVDIVPPSLALAQAAKESAWGTSRFSLHGYNYFGQWCFEKGCGIVPNKRDTDKKHEVAVFDSPEMSVESYIHNLNSYYTYRPLRDIRAELNAAQTPITGMALADGLGKYSERGTDYIKEIRSLIRNNNLLEYDTQ